MKVMRYLIILMYAASAIFYTSCVNAEGLYPPIINEGESYVPPTRDQMLWALATCAVLTESNRGRHDLLGWCEKTPEIMETRRKLLAQWWGIRNRKDLLEKLKWLREGGHRRQFDEIAQKLSAMTFTEQEGIRRQVESNLDLSNKIEIVLKYKDEFGGKSISAWDYVRYISLCGFCYTVGYLTEEEAWRRIMPAARLLQKTFDSWEDLGKNHVVGREFWSLDQAMKQGRLTRQRYQKLLQDPSSPWLRIKWDMDLMPKK